MTPVSVIEPRGFTTSKHSAKKVRVVLYLAESALSEIIPFFDVCVHVKLLLKRTRIPQCERWFSWYNERACSRNFRYRMWDSTKHTESRNSSCNPNLSHNCPSRYVTCHGQRQTDSLECLVRPRKDDKMPSRAAVTKIRQATSAVRMKLKTTHCDDISKKNKQKPLRIVHSKSIWFLQPPKVYVDFSQSLQC